MDWAKVPRWMRIVLVVALIAFVAPPLLTVLFVAVGVALAIGAVLLKMAFVGLVLYAGLLLLRSMLGNSGRGNARAVTASTGSGASLAVIESDWEQAQREKMAALDAELERAIHNKNDGGGTAS